MAIAEDASTPAVVGSGSTSTSATIVTASFSPPAGSLLVIMGGWGYFSAWTTAPTLSITGSAGSFTYVSKAFVQEASKFIVGGVWVADVPTAPGAMTITMTRAGSIASGTGRLAVRVVTGADVTANQSGAVVNTTHAASKLMNFSLTPTVLNSQVYAQSLYSDAGSGNTLTPTADTTTVGSLIDATTFITIAHGKGTTLVSALSPTSYGWTTSDTTANETITQGLEILPGATNYTANPADSVAANDRLPPVPPDGLTATVASSTEIDLAWSMVAGAVGYDVERDGTVISTGQTARTLADTGRTASTTYNYNVRSVY